MNAPRLLAACLLTLALGSPAAAAEGVAVLELFTSEGCSSCPPAEALANELDLEGRENGQPIYVLAFHVDYWNDLGWIDRFSTEAFSERQRRYAPLVSQGRVYTPQLVVNGRRGFVGSHRSKAEAEVKTALRERASVEVSLRAKRGPQGVEVTVEPRSAPRGAVLSLALVSNGEESKVTLGENRGRTLHHRGVVRSFEAHPADGKVQTVLALPEGADPGLTWSVVAWVQEGETKRVLGARRVDL